MGRSLGSGLRLVTQWPMMLFLDLLTQEDITLSVIDRATGRAVATIKGCLPTGVSQDLSSKQLASGSNSYLGLLLNTEDFQNDENASSATLPA